MTETENPSIKVPFPFFKQFKDEEIERINQAIGRIAQAQGGSIDHCQVTVDALEYLASMAEQQQYCWGFPPSLVIPSSRPIG